MSQLTEADIRNVVTEVLSKLKTSGTTVVAPAIQRRTFDPA